MTEILSDQSRSLRARAEAALGAIAEGAAGAPADLSKLLHELQVHQVELELQNEELRRSQDALEESRGRYMRLFHQAPVGYLILDRVGMIRQANATFAAMVAPGGGDGVVGRAFTDFLPVEDQRLFLARLKSFFKHPVDKEMQLRLVTAAGTSLVVALTAGSMEFVEQEQERGGEIFVVVSDISQRARADEKLTVANRQLDAAILRARTMTMEAEAANSAKSNFLATMGNELRSPLSGMLEMTETLLASELSPEQRYSAESVQNSGRRLLHLVDGILDFSTIEAGRLELVSEIFSPRQLLEEIVTAHTPQLQEKRLALFRSVDSAVPQQLYGDPGRLRQIIGNLLANAITFTNAGSVELTLSREEAEGGEPLLRCTVRDTGCGISPEKLALLFAKSGGSTLGLAISRRLVEMMGGKIGVNSEPGRGSEFWFTVRCGGGREGGAGSAEQTAAITPMELPAAGKTRILVAEDDITSRTILSAILHKWGYEPLTVADGRAAWEVIRSPQAPKLAILDWDMPGMSGPEVCRLIRASGNATTPPYLIILTAKDDTSDIVAGLDAGANDYVTKPYDNSELQARIRVGVRMVELQDELLAARQALVYEAMHDALTGVLSRRAILELLDKELVGSRRQSRAMAVGICDIDHFKRINDTYGHLIGDEVLKAFATTIASNLRENDHFGRFGGEEFLIVAPDTQGMGRENLYERLRQVVADLVVPSQAGDIRVTMSVGVAFSEMGSDGTALLAAADEALYAAKNRGRNRVVFADQLNGGVEDVVATDGGGD